MRYKVLQEQHSCSVQETARKNTKYSRSENVFKIDHLAKAIAFAKWSVWVKNNNAKNMPNTSLQEQQSCSVQKTAQKNTKYSRNETILKIGHLERAIAHAKAIAFPKSSVWVKN